METILIEHRAFIFCTYCTKLFLFYRKLNVILCLAALYFGPLLIPFFVHLSIVSLNPNTMRVQPRCPAYEYAVTRFMFSSVKA